jgi:hypothetical protein
VARRTQLLKLTLVLCDGKQKNDLGRPLESENITTFQKKKVKLESSAKKTTICNTWGTKEKGTDMDS